MYCRCYGNKKCIVDYTNMGGAEEEKIWKGELDGQKKLVTNQVP